jgi:hypothetical protein
MGLLEDRKKSQYLQMAEEKLQGLLNLPMQAQRFITSPTAFLGLLGQNPLPRESGFAAGATGLPPTEMSVLDPNQAPYMQGYGQGEPVGYAGMALPFAAPAAVATGRALAPKAGQALESYMVNQGLLQPLTAYHGTPHTIQGKFDINKVGTGEGAQAYGHGMYFAENPAVAGEYQRKLSGGLGSASNELLLNGKPLTDLTDAQRRAYEIVARDGRRNATGTAKDLESQGFDASHIREALNATKGKEISLVKNEGNLYKVDIPDADIPMMLDWDKPFSKQPKAVQEVIKQIEPKIKQVNPNINVEKLSGEGIYRAYQQYRGNQPDFASEGLNELGIKGIRYLDQGSRNPGFSSLTPTQLQSRIESLQESINSGAGNTQALKEKLKSLQNEMDSYKDMTSNFVVFDPSTVKILEKNKKKVEGLLD